MKTLDDIPREDLIAMLKEQAWFSAGREEYGKVAPGYSFDVREETSIRDVVYRDEPLYESVETALLAHWLKHYPK